MRTRCGAVRKRSTITIKNAFAAFCAHIRNLPQDSQLSKIRTLRLATQYIKFLMEILKENDRQETSTHKNNPDLPGDGNTESIVSLIAGYCLTVNIGETLRLLRQQLPSYYLFFFYDSTASRFRTRAEKTENKYQMAAAYLGKRTKGLQVMLF